MDEQCTPPSTLAVDVSREMVVEVRIENVAWRCKVDGRRVVSTIRVAWGVNPLRRQTIEFISLAKWVRCLASRESWTAEELLSAIAEGLVRLGAENISVSMELDEGEGITVTAMV